MAARWLAIGNPCSGAAKEPCGTQQAQRSLNLLGRLHFRIFAAFYKRKGLTKQGSVLRTTAPGGGIWNCRAVAQRPIRESRVSESASSIWMQRVGVALGCVVWMCQGIPLFVHAELPLRFTISMHGTGARCNRLATDGQVCVSRCIEAYESTSRMKGKWYRI